MNYDNLSRIKISTTSLPLTSFAGLPLLLEMAHHLGITKEVNNIPGLQERKRKHNPADYLMSLMLTLASGGDTLDEVDVIRKDSGLNKIIGDIAAANSIGEFLRRFDRSAAYRLSKISSRIAIENLKRKNLNEITLDIDSSLIEANKIDAHKTYKGFPGYSPLLVWIAEANVWLSGVFRQGNSSPQSHLLPLLKRCVRLIPQGTSLRLRSDSAGFQIKLMDFCRNHNILFAIRAKHDDAVNASIENIPKNAWKIIETKKECYAIAETVHAMSNNPKTTMPAFRLIVKRKFTGQLELFKNLFVDYPVITNAPADWHMEQVLAFYNARGNMEKAIGILKNETGLCQLPCGSLLANTAYFQTTLLTYNLLQLFKLHALPCDWYNFGWAKLRHRLIGQAALIVSHARDMVLKLAKDYVYYPIFRDARWAVFRLSYAFS
jgi:hypothetical protein